MRGARNGPAVMGGSSGAMAIQGARMLAACGLAYAASWAFGLHEGYWAVITALVVMQPEFADTLVASRNRVAGTLIGAAAGLAVLAAGQRGWPVFWLFWLALAPLAVLTAYWPGLRLSGVTLVVVVLLPAAAAPYARAFDRIFAILLGTLASIAVSAIIVSRRS